MACISYHGTKYKNLNSILRNGFKAGDGALYGKGFYSSPSLEMVERRYAQKFTLDEEEYKVVFQNRVNPDQLNGHLKVVPASETDAGADYWLATKQDPSSGVYDVRPYGMLFKKMM